MQWAGIFAAGALLNLLLMSTPALSVLTSVRTPKPLLPPKCFAHGAPVLGSVTYLTGVRVSCIRMLWCTCQRELVFRACARFGEHAGVSLDMNF